MVCVPDPSLGMRLVELESMRGMCGEPGHSTVGGMILCMVKWNRIPYEVILTSPCLLVAEVETIYKHVVTIFLPRIKAIVITYHPYMRLFSFRKLFCDLLLTRIKATVITY